ncbi:MAG: DegT/DnrJ/EryC1/StrS family aminotransferase [Candidatus Bathyarchaeia archaeon]
MGFGIALNRPLRYVAPFVVPYWKRDELETIARCILSNKLVKGEFVSRVEREFSKRFNVKYSKATNSGRSAIYLGLIGLGLKPGDEVILPSFGCLAMLQPILKIGCTPVFADIDDNLNIDPSSIEKCISDKTKVIIMAHLCGKVANIKQIMDIAQKRGLAVLDDAAQACGAKYGQKFVGTHGHVGIFSFGMGKNIMATQGGMLVTNSEEIFEKAINTELSEENSRDVLKRLVNVFLEFRLRRLTRLPYIAIRKISSYVKEKPSDSYPLLLPSRKKMSNLDAALALIQLSKLDMIIRKRVRNANLLTEYLTGINEIETPEGAYPEHIFTKYVIRVSDGVMSPTYKRVTTLVKMAMFLERRGIEPEWLYTPLHLRICNKNYKRIELPKTEDLYRRVICLPINPFLSEEQIRYIASNVREFFKSQSK